MATTKRGKRIRAVVIATAIFFSGFTTNVIASPQVIEETADPLVVYYDIPVSEPLQDYIYDLCCENNVPMSLIVAMMDKESEFNSQAISKTKDYGLMQINSSNHKWLREKYKVQDFLNPYENVYCGIKIIGEFLEKYGDEHKALMVYNMGEDNAKRCWKKGMTSSSYSKDVMSLYELYETNHNWEVQRLGEQNN